jgi:hypothetical protein
MDEHQHIDRKMTRRVVAGREFLHVDEAHLGPVPAQVAHRRPPMAVAARMQRRQRRPRRRKGALPLIRRGIRHQRAQGHAQIGRHEVIRPFGQDRGDRQPGGTHHMQSLAVTLEGFAPAALLQPPAQRKLFHPLQPQPPLGRFQHPHAHGRFGKRRCNHV